MMAPLQKSAVFLMLACVAVMASRPAANEKGTGRGRGILRTKSAAARMDTVVQAESSWPEIQARYFAPLVTSARHGAQRTRDLVTVITIRSLESARRRLSTGWLPEGAGATARLAGRTARENVFVLVWSPVPRRFLYVPMSLACTMASVSLLACASALRTVELAARCTVSVATDLAQQAALFAQFATAVAAGRGPTPVPVPPLPPPMPVAEPVARQEDADSANMDAQVGAPGESLGADFAAVGPIEAPTPNGGVPGDVQTPLWQGEPGEVDTTSTEQSAPAGNGRGRARWSILPAQLRLLNLFGARRQK